MIKKHPNKTTFSKNESNVAGVVFSYNLSKYVIFYKGYGKIKGWEPLSWNHSVKEFIVKKTIIITIF